MRKRLLRRKHFLLRKRLLLSLAMAAVLLLVCGCGSNDAADAPDAAEGAASPPAAAGPPSPPQTGSASLEGKEIIEIRERMFMTQVNDIYTNPGNYVGKGVRFEGIYIEETYGDGEVFRAVVRMNAGCCGDDGRSGFEVVWDQPYPKFNDWVEVSGVLEQYEEDGQRRLRVRLASLKVLPVRGLEFVTQ